jgi:hypothetical protein
MAKWKSGARLGVVPQFKHKCAQRKQTADFDRAPAGGNKPDFA